MSLGECRLEPKDSLRLTAVQWSDQLDLERRLRVRSKSIDESFARTGGKDVHHDESGADLKGWLASNGGKKEGRHESSPGVAPSLASNGGKVEQDKAGTGMLARSRGRLRAIWVT